MNLPSATTGTGEPASLLTSGPAASDTFWPTTITDNTDCQSCGNAVDGNYCSHCGQKKLLERLALGQLVAELFSRVFNWERGWLYTFCQMFVRPGQVARDYVSGRQKCYVNPLTYYFLGAAAQLLMLWWHGPLLRQRIEESFGQDLFQTIQPETMEKIQGILGQPLPAAMVDIYLSSIQQSYTYAALLFFCFPFALATRFFQRLAGYDYRLGETLVLALYLFGHVLLVTAIMALVTIRYSTTVHFGLSMAIYFFWPQWAQVPFFNKGYEHRALTFAATAVATILFMGSIVLVFAVSFACYFAYCATIFEGP